jgi:ABC-2 type transport system permease protein
VGAAVTGTTAVCDVTLTQCLYYVLGRVLSLLTGVQWANIAVTGVTWLVVPMAIGLTSSTQARSHSPQPV